MPDGLESVYHITHWKAGSQWVQGVLRALQPERLVVPPEAVADGSELCPVVPGAVYSPLYLNKLRFDESPFSAAPHRKFLVIRDLRDTLVSWYFSLLETHGENPVVLRHRAHLRTLGRQEGLMYLLNHQDFYGLAMVSATWLDAPGVLTVRFEELVERPGEVFARLCGHCGIEASRLDEVLRSQSFEALSGRSRGSEGVSHYRRGTPGDWERHFSEGLKRQFSQKYDDLVWRCGYRPILPPGYWRERRAAGLAD